MAGIVVIFDFDRTLIDDDSDSWVVSQMGLTSLFNQLRSALPWNSLMDRMMTELHLQGKSSEDIVHCLRETPLHPKIIGAIKSAHALGCELRVISDANLFFIEEILDHHGLLGCFSQIHTNPATMDEHGRLRISPYHDLGLPPHGCSMCPPNMCKGLIINKIYSNSISEKKKKRFIYIGDGGGDYCPCLKLGEGDYVMPRKKYPLWKRILDEPMLIKAQVHEWSEGEELAEILVQIIHTISTDRKATG
ncbi:Thiamine phosphate phosphatase-like protein [Linum perenne]